jgi:hypothetical protein
VFWWEYVAIARRVVLAAAVTLVPFTEQQLAAVIIMTVLLVSIALQHAFVPFATVLENRLEQLSLSVLLLAFLGVYVAETSADAATPLTWLPILVMVLVSVTAVVLLVATVLVLLIRVLPKLADTTIGRQLLDGSPLVRKADSLRDRLLVPTDTEASL